MSVLLDQLVFPAVYLHTVHSESVDEEVRGVCFEIKKRYDVKFLEIGCDSDPMHFLVQSVPKNSVTKLVTLIKSLTARIA